MQNQDNKFCFKFEEIKKTYSSSAFAFPNHCEYACAVEIYRPSIGEKIFSLSQVLTPIALFATVCFMVFH